MSSVVLLKNRTTPKDPYYNKFVENGYNPIFVPLLEHSHFDKTSTIKYLQSAQFEKVSKFIITSQRAVECLNECLEEIGDEATKSRIYNKIGYTVGPATCKFLQESGFKYLRGGIDAGNGAILAEIIVREYTAGEEFVFFTGEIRRDIIPKALDKAGIKFTELVVYKTQERSEIGDSFALAMLELKREEEAATTMKLLLPPWVIFFSPQGTRGIIEHIKQDSSISLNIGAIGVTTEEYLVNFGVKPAIVAKKPEPNSLFDLIHNYNSNNKP